MFYFKFHDTNIQLKNEISKFSLEISYLIFNQFKFNCSNYAIGHI